MKAELKTPAIVVVVIALVAVIGWVGMKAVGGSGNLDQGQVKYTPGKPPWLETDPSKKGPGGSPSGGGPGVPSPAQTAPGAPNGAPVGPPTLGNGPK